MVDNKLLETKSISIEKLNNKINKMKKEIQEKKMNNYNSKNINKQMVIMIMMLIWIKIWNYIIYKKN